MKNPALYREIFEPETAALAPRFADRAMMITCAEGHAGEPDTEPQKNSG